jgi:AcrR family transcriptional regulator
VADHRHRAGLGDRARELAVAPPPQPPAAGAGGFQRRHGLGGEVAVADDEDVEIEGRVGHGAQLARNGPQRPVTRVCSVCVRSPFGFAPMWETRAVDTVAKTPLRADARKNRAAMLRAAREVFAEQGLDAPLDLIARTAGVGRGTQHRHFPTRESLLIALFEENLEDLETVVQEADPDDAYVELLRATVAQLQRDRGFNELSDSRVPTDIRDEMAERFLKIVARPLRRAQRVGRIRRDLKPDDTLMLLAMVTGSVHAPGRGTPERRMEKALEIVMEHITL